MFKVIGAISFGLLSVCGVTYLVLKQQDDKAYANQVDCYVANFFENLKQTSTRLVESVKSQIQTGPTSVEVSAN